MAPVSAQGRQARVDVSHVQSDEDAAVDEDADDAMSDNAELDEAARLIDLLATALTKIEALGCKLTRVPDAFLCDVDAPGACAGCIAHEALGFYRGR